ncbi:unnamed protein product, partial [Allacma fusca]
GTDKYKTYQLRFSPAILDHSLEVQNKEFAEAAVRLF